MMGDLKVLGIIVIILLCDGVQNTELKGPHFPNPFERGLEPSPPVFKSPSLRHPLEWAAFRNYWSSLIRNRLPMIGWGAKGTESPQVEEELEHVAEDVKNMDIDAPIITEKYDVSSSIVPATAVEVYNTNEEFMPVKVTEVKPISGVTVTDIKFTDIPPVKVVSVPYTTLEIPLHPPAASYPNHHLQATTQTPIVPTTQPSLLEILLEDYLCKSSTHPNCENLISIKHEQHPGKPNSEPELPLVLKVRKPSTAVVNNEKKGPYSSTPAPYFQVNIKDILGPEAYATAPLKLQHHDSSSYTPIGTSYTTEKEVTTNAATTPYTPVDTTKHTTQASYITTPVIDKTSSYTHNKIPEVTTYSTMKEVTPEASTTTYIPVDITESTSKSSYTTIPTTEKYHETTSYPKTDSPKDSSYNSNKETTTKVLPTQQTPDVIEYTTKASYTTIPTTHYHEETTTYPSTYPTIPTTQYHEETTTNPSTYPTISTTQYHEETTTHPSTAIPFYSTHTPKKETTTDSASTPYTKVDKMELTSEASYTTVPTTEYHHETSSHTPVEVTKVSTEEHTMKIPVRYNDRLTNLHSPIKHSSESSYTTVAVDTSNYTTTKMPETSTQASLTTTPQLTTTGTKSSYAPKATTKLTGGSETEKYLGVDTTPSSEKYATSTVENTEKFTTNSPYSESTVTSTGPQATLSELSYDRPLTLALNDNSDQQIEVVPKKKTHPLKSVPSIPQFPYNMSPYYAPSNSYPTYPFPQQGLWNYGNEFQAYPYPYYFPHT